MPAAERMKSMRDRRRAADLRELRLVLPDTRLAAVRKRVASQVEALGRDSEADALTWIEAVSESEELGASTGR